jgi:vancomycin resistance protein YoaR
MHNIARSAASFYGIVIAPGEQFSFNHYLGEISEEQGYTRGLIIAGGRTIEGIGGGVCQVSTTVFQAAFVGGFQIDERWQHGYRVQYYESGLGVGLDAAVYSPDIDMRFTNDTPYHLLIENYYNEATQSLTFKFYSTGMGRTVTWTTEIWGERPARPDIYEYNPDLEGNQLDLVDWAVEGAKVLIKRTIINRWGETKLLDEPFYSDYIPWANIYQYGPDYVFPTPTPVPSADPPPSDTTEDG